MENTTQRYWLKHKSRLLVALLAMHVRKKGNDLTWLSHYIGTTVKNILLCNKMIEVLQEIERAKTVKQIFTGPDGHK